MPIIRGYGRKCESQDCRKEAINIHHKNRNKKDNNSNNLRYLCASCHRKDHHESLNEDGPILRPRDTYDYFTQPQRQGYRFTSGFNMLNKSEQSE